MIDVREYDTVITKDGETAAILMVLEKDKAFLADFGEEAVDERTIYIEDIEKVVYRPN